MFEIILLSICASLADVPDVDLAPVDLVRDGEPVAVVVLPADAEPIAVYAADELVYHVEKASGATLKIVHEPLDQRPDVPAVYVGATQAARAAGIDPETLAVLDTNLALIDSAIGEVRLVLDRDGVAVESTHILTALYNKKLDVLLRATRLSS